MASITTSGYLVRPAWRAGEPSRLTVNLVSLKTEAMRDGWGLVPGVQWLQGEAYSGTFPALDGGWWLVTPQATARVILTGLVQTVGGGVDVAWCSTGAVYMKDGGS